MNFGPFIRGWRGHALLVVICLGLYLPGLATLPPTDRDEARFAQASRQMLESRDFLQPRFQEEPRNKKPAGIYWLQAASVTLLSNAESTAIWPYRLPSLLGAILAVLLTFRFGAAWLGREIGFAGALLLASSLGLTIEAHLAKTDAVLLATVVAAQGALGEIYRRSCIGDAVDTRLPALFWIAVGVGILVKGPITPVLSLLTLVTVSLAERDAGWLRELRAGWGLPLALVIAGPWLLAIMATGGGAFARESIGHDLLDKLIHAQEGHWAPPGTYLAAAFVTFWPGSIALGGAAFLAWRERRDTVVRLLVAWIVPFWIVLEVVPTKLPHYALPLYPALALLAARALAEAPGKVRRWVDFGATLLWSLVTLALAGALPFAALRFAGAIPPAVAVFAALIAIASAGFLVTVWRRPPRVLLGAVAAILLSEGVFAFTLPRLDSLWLSRGAARLIAEHRLEGRPVVATGYTEPSLVFLLGTRTRLTAPEEAAKLMESAPATLALVSDREDAAFRAALAAGHVTPTAVGAVQGLNYSNGRKMTLTLYVAAAR